MEIWTYLREFHATFAAERLLRQREEDWVIFRNSAADLWVWHWLRSLRGADLADYCSLMPRLELGLPLEQKLKDRAETLRRMRNERMTFTGFSIGANASVLAALRQAMDERFGHRGRRSEDGMRAYRWTVGEVEFEVEYRLRGRVHLELELAHASIPRLIPGMILATPTSMQVGEQEDVEQAGRYVGAWLDEVAAFVRATPISRDDGSSAPVSGNRLR